MTLSIRKETPDDFPIIYDLIRSAFEYAEHTDYDEQNLVVRLRRGPSYIPELSLVAEDEGRLVGHIMLTKVKVGDVTALAVAPLSVLPDMQGKGIGAALIKAAHQQAAVSGYDFCILLGHAAYYSRFGYKPAVTFGIQSPFDVPEANFMAFKVSGASSDRLEGLVEYPPAFFESGL